MTVMTSGEKHIGMIVELEVCSIYPNAYNPNHMSEDDFQEFVKEVRHLGRLPKPIIVRKNGDGHEIIDGEHGWRAAKEVGLKTVPSEVLEADNFEARRQTYKRNQHGDHNPVLLGRMFREMKAERELSNRKLASLINVSEGTIRNNILYAEAGDLRNEYTEDNAIATSDVSALKVKQVRCYLELPMLFRDLWMTCGASTKELFWAVLDSRKQVEQEDCQGGYEQPDESHKYVCKQISDRGGENTGDLGLWGYLNLKTRSASRFGEDVRKLVKWDRFNRGFVCHGLTVEDIRAYTKHYLNGVWYVRDESMMGKVMRRIIKPPVFDRSTCQYTSPAELLLTPEELERLIDETGKESASSSDFDERLELALVEKHGYESCGKSQRMVHDELQKITLEAEAPDYIRESELPHEAQWILFNLHGKASRMEDNKRGAEHVEAVKTIAELPKKDIGPVLKGWDNKISDMMTRTIIYLQEKDTLANVSTEDMAKEIAGFVYWDVEETTDAQKTSMAENLLKALTKEEIYALYQNGKRWGWIKFTRMLVASLPSYT